MQISFPQTRKQWVALNYLKMALIVVVQAGMAKKKTESKRLYPSVGGAQNPLQWLFKSGEKNQPDPDPSRNHTEAVTEYEREGWSWHMDKALFPQNQIWKTFFSSSHSGHELW